MKWHDYSRRWKFHNSYIKGYTIQWQWLIILIYGNSASKQHNSTRTSYFCFFFVVRTDRRFKSPWTARRAFQLSVSSKLVHIPWSRANWTESVKKGRILSSSKVLSPSWHNHLKLNFAHPRSEAVGVLDTFFNLVDCATVHINGLPDKPSSNVAWNWYFVLSNGVQFL